MIGIPSEGRISDVQARLEAMDKTLDRAEKDTGLLLEKLSVVLREVSPIAREKEGQRCSVEAVAVCELSHSISIRTQRIESLCDQMEGMAERLEI